MKPLAVRVLLSVYFVSYAIARIAIFHAVEHYAGGFKTPPRQDYITKKGEPAGSGWQIGREYDLLAQ